MNKSSFFHLYSQNLGSGTKPPHKTPKVLFIQNLLLYFAQDYKPPEINNTRSTNRGKRDQAAECHQLLIGGKRLQSLGRLKQGEVKTTRHRGPLGLQSRPRPLAGVRS